MDFFVKAKKKEVLPDHKSDSVGKKGVILQENSATGDAVAAGVNTRNLTFKPVKYDSEWGKFEKHTKGFGSKYLEKYNFKGRLGKREQGITKPIMVLTRKQGAGLGSVREATNLKQNREIAEDIFGKKMDSTSSDDDDDEAMVEDQIPLWQRGYGENGSAGYASLGDKSNSRQNYKKRKRGKDFPNDGIKGIQEDIKRTTTIVDMRYGKPQNVEKVSNKLERGIGIELLYNINMLVENIDNDFYNLKREKRAKELHRSSLQSNKSMLQITANNARDDIKKLEHIFSLLESCKTLACVTTSESNVKGSRYTWLDQIEKVFLVLREKFSDYFHQYGLYRVMPEVILPWINKSFRKENGKFIDQSKEMRKVMERVYACFGNYEFPCSTKEELNIFDQIMDKSVVLKMEREIIQNNWNPIENSDVLINLLILWRKDNLMSDYHFNSLIDDQIVPKLMHTLESSYNSSRFVDSSLNVENSFSSTTIPPHLWLHQWLPLLKEKIHRLSDVISQVLATIITTALSRNGKHRDAVEYLLPWRGILSTWSLDEIIESIVIPHLVVDFRRAASNYVSLTYSFNNVKNAIKWSELLNPINLLSLLEGEFFPYCIQGLKKLLGDNNGQKQIDLKLVLGWYNNLKASIDGPNNFIKKFQYSDRMQESLNKILSFINAYLSNGSKAVAILEAPKVSTYEQMLQLNQLNDIKDDIERGKVINGANRLPTMENKPPLTRKMNFKALLESIAEKEELLFMPWDGGRQHSNGKAIYIFGNACKIYMDNGVVFLKGNTNEWEPVSLEDLILKAKSMGEVKHEETTSKNTHEIPEVAETDIDDLD